MSTSSWIILVIVIVVVVLAVASLGMVAHRKKKERDRRNRAGELREKAVVEEGEARRLEAEARDRQKAARERLRQADDMDPDAGREGEHTKPRTAVGREDEAEPGRHRG
jgi:flagellar basal body-associated protein FliL